MAFSRDFDENPVDAEFKQKINVEFLVLKQIDRCNNAALEGDEIKFSNGVEGLLAMLPKENRLRIESDKIKSTYITKIEQPVYKYSAGKPMGTIENPIYRNNPKDWNYDGGEPILVSPTVEEVEQTDYQKLFKIVLNELQDVGVTWKIEPRGNVEKRIDPPPTPLLKLNNGKFVRILVEKGVEGIQEGIIKDEVEKPKTVDVRKDVAGTEPESDPDAEPESDPDGEDGDGEEEGDPDESEGEDAEGKTETDSGAENEDGEGQKEEKEDEDEEYGESYTKQLDDAQDESLEEYKKKKELEEIKKKQMKAEREKYNNENKREYIVVKDIETIKQKENIVVEKNEPKNDKFSKEDEKELLKYITRQKKKEKKKKPTEEPQNKTEENVVDKIQ